jgi:hypothetical protein
MARPKEASADLVPLTIIRTETALSRYPVHKISKQGDVSIEIRKKDDRGATTLLWEVSYNSRFGQPGPLAYKLDTLVINRRIEEAGRPVPKAVRLGSLRDICRELGISEGENLRTVRRALRQNASAFISAKISYKDTLGGERTLEADFNRYTVLFTGETLPDGRKADSVYLILNDVYMEVLNAAVARPLDYDYLKALAPAPQRFYEIVSYQIYAALRYNLPRAKLAYSEFCTYSTMTRYFDYDHVKKQMYKVHRPHIGSEYLAKVEFEATTDEDGRPDWTMFYTPGPKARLEHQAFMQRRKYPKMQGHLFPEEEAQAEKRELLGILGGEDMAGTGAEAPADPETAALAEKLAGQGLNRADAERLARESPEECRRQLAYLAHVTEFKSSRGAYLRAAIEQGFGPPRAFEDARAQETERQGERARAAGRKARQSHQEAHDGAYREYLASMLAEAQESRPEAFSAFSERDAERRKGLLRLARSSRGKMVLEEFDREESRLLRFAEFFQGHPDCPVLSFWEWDRALNPHAFRQAGRDDAR